MDRESIGWGEGQRTKIQDGLDAAFAFIPAISMSYFYDLMTEQSDGSGSWTWPRIRFSKRTVPRRQPGMSCAEGTFLACHAPKVPFSAFDR